MKFLWFWVSQHPALVWTVVGGFSWHCFSALVDAISLEKPTANDGRGYRIFYNFVQSLAANYSRKV